MLLGTLSIVAFLILPLDLDSQLLILAYRRKGHGVQGHSVKNFDSSNSRIKFMMALRTSMGNWVDRKRGLIKSEHSKSRFLDAGDKKITKRTISAGNTGESSNSQPSDINNFKYRLPLGKPVRLVKGYKRQYVDPGYIGISDTRAYLDNTNLYNSSMAISENTPDSIDNGIFFIGGTADASTEKDAEQHVSNNPATGINLEETSSEEAAEGDNAMATMDQFDYGVEKHSVESGECTKKSTENIKEVLFGEDDTGEATSHRSEHFPAEKKETMEDAESIKRTENEKLIQEIKFPKNYHVTGILSLPYDDIQEPFEAWYAGGKNMSRIDYYYGMDKTYQRGDIGHYGVLVKLTPAHWNKKGSLDKNTYSCWFREEPKWAPQKGQSVIPLRLKKFKVVGEEIFNGVPAYKLQFQKKIYQKNNTYTFYVTKSKPHLPLRYEMVGFDHLLSSHYDNYILDYLTFKKWDYDFNILKIPKDFKCFKELKKLTTRYEANPMSEFVHNEETGHREKEVHQMFDHFKKAHGKKYDDDKEEARRKDLFRHNLRFIHSKNRANLNYSLALNEFADVTDEEFEKYKGLRKDEDENAIKREVDQIPVLRLEIPKEPLPENLDWREYGAVTKVKSQSSCGACWSFSAIGAIEGAYSIQAGKLEEFSEQQLIDCSWGYHNNGCRGGWSWRALNWIRENGIATKRTYGKYLGQEGYCHCDKKDNCTVIDKVSYKTIPKHNKEKLKIALAKFGPASLAVHCDRKTFKFFGSGIYDDPKCNHVTDHAVLIVGYGVENKVPYWIIKNSWGALWGDHGYMKIAMKNDLCGVLQNGALVVSMKSWKDLDKEDFPYKKMKKINYEEEVEGTRKISFPIQPPLFLKNYESRVESPSSADSGKENS